jgi:hypothetical protein
VEVNNPSGQNQEAGAYDDSSQSAVFQPGCQRGAMCWFGLHFEVLPVLMIKFVG